MWLTIYKKFLQIKIYRLYIAFSIEFWMWFMIDLSEDSDRILRIQIGLWVIVIRITFPYRYFNKK